MLQLVSNGLLVWVSGHPMIVSNVSVYDDHTADKMPRFPESNPTGQVVRFTGTCADHPNNDQIENTSYNGGTYGGNKLAGYVW